MAELDIGILGCGGRMGRMLIERVVRTPGCRLAGGAERAESPQLGRDLGTLAGLEPVGLAATADVEDLFARSRVVIDFTAPAATVAHAETAARLGTALVIGTTGLGPEDEAAVRRAAEKTAIVYAPNMSPGVILLQSLTEQVARVMGMDYDIEILEMHHRHKVDSPSGTALALGRAAAAGRGVDLGAVTRPPRHGQVGPRVPGEIGFASLRGGDVVGDHSVIFAAEGERIELTHKASGRGLFAKGAVRAALWVAGRAPGLYAMQDVLGL